MNSEANIRFDHEVLWLIRKEPNVCCLNEYILLSTVTFKLQIMILKILPPLSIFFTTLFQIALKI